MDVHESLVRSEDDHDYQLLTKRISWGPLHRGRGQGTVSVRESKNKTKHASHTQKAHRSTNKKSAKLNEIFYTWEVHDHAKTICVHNIFTVTGIAWTQCISKDHSVCGDDKTMHCAYDKFVYNSYLITFFQKHFFLWVRWRGGGGAGGGK